MSQFDGADYPPLRRECSAPMILDVRKMGPDDSLAWADMRHQMWGCQSVARHLQDIELIFANSIQRTGYHAIVDDDVSVGFAEVSIRDFANGCVEQPVPFLECIWVEPGFQRQSIARALLTVIEFDLMDLGFEELCSNASIDNKTAHHAHLRWGFEESNRIVYFQKSISEQADRWTN